jgi:HlyD family secretion protein
VLRIQGVKINMEKIPYRCKIEVTISNTNMAFTKKFFKKFFKLARRPIFFIPATIVVILIVIISAKSGNKTDYSFVVAERGDLVQEVSVTGRVKASEDVDLAFERAGTVAQIYKDIGDSVGVGDSIVSLRNSDILALLNQAQAQAAAAEATLLEISGNKSAEQALSNYYNDVLNTINDSLSKSEDAVRSKTTGLFSGNLSIGYNLTFSTCNSSISREAKDLRTTAELEIERWNDEFTKLGAAETRATYDSALTAAQNHLEVVQQFVDAVNRALLTNCALNNSSLDTARASMATAQTNITTAITNINTLKQNIASQRISVANDDAVAAQEARVRAAQASVDNYQSQLNQTVLRSPIEGIVTKQDAKIGETVSLNTPVVSVISTAKFEIDANIPEVDIAKVKIGDTANVTLDAYGSDVVFDAHVISIEPAGTIIEGVTTYKTTLQFNSEDDRVKSGMTANIDILTAEKKNVIAVPQRTVIKNDRGKFVKILVGKNDVSEVPVETGLRGSDGTIEITKGINEGDKVITFTP